MKKIAVSARPIAVALGFCVSVTACDAPQRTGDPAGPQFSSASTPSALLCRSAEAKAGRGRVLPGGGSVAVGGNVVVVPGAAIAAATEIAIEVPASNRMVVELTANDHDHWQFLSPVSVTIDYSRCPASELGDSLAVYHVDLATGALLERMGGVDNREARTITFTTDHFSGYAIAN